MKHWWIRITDGNDITHCWKVAGKTMYDALVYLLETFNDDSYGMPIGIRFDGIKKVETTSITESEVLS